jgi:hypothetical protein
MANDTGSELPAIGAPARRALEGAGIATLEQVRTQRREALLALHGVGPKAIATLRDALAERGWTFADVDGGRPVRPPEVERYVDELDDGLRQLFERLEALIVDERPDVTIVFSYQIPLYRVGRHQVGLSAGPGRITLTTTSPQSIAGFTAGTKGFRTGKASIQLPVDAELPEAALREVVRRELGG